MVGGVDAWMDWLGGGRREGEGLRDVGRKRKRGRGVVGGRR